MDQIIIYLILLGLVAVVGIAFSKAQAPTAVILVVVGMLLSWIPQFPQVVLDPKVVMDLFLPLLVYQASAVMSWRDVKSNLSPVAFLSFGHVVFITILVAVTIHYFIPNLGWPLAFALGAIVSPPDPVAIIAVSEKISLPHRLLTILKAEGLLNDATALIIYRLALAAVITHQFSIMNGVIGFCLIVVGETLYGIVIGCLSGEIRLRVQEPILQTLLSLITPFLAFLVPQRLGGSGVLATVVAGLVIGHFYIARFTPENRLLALSIWPTLAFIVENLLFLLLGLDFRFIIERISAIPISSLLLYAAAVVLVVIIGRFIWVYPAAYLPRLFKKGERRRLPRLSWQQPFIISWAGMRGGVSLAAALAIPILPMTVEGANSKDLIVFIAFCVIIVTLVLQGLALPLIIKSLGVETHTNHEKYRTHIAELKARLEMTSEVVKWLNGYKDLVRDDPQLSEEVKLYSSTYQTRKKQLQERIKSHKDMRCHDEESELREAVLISTKIVEVERNTLMRMWHERRIEHAVRNKLIEQLDLHAKHLK